MAIRARNSVILPMYYSLLATRRFGGVSYFPHRLISSPRHRYIGHKRLFFNIWTTYCQTVGNNPIKVGLDPSWNVDRFGLLHKSSFRRKDVECNLQSSDDAYANIAIVSSESFSASWDLRDPLEDNENSLRFPQKLQFNWHRFPIHST
jgi:hypothetical protein